jgi:hypothetical protein
MLLRREGGDSTSCAGQGMLAKDLSSSKCRRSIDLLGLATAGLRTVCKDIRCCSSYNAQAIQCCFRHRLFAPHDEGDLRYRGAGDGDVVCFCLDMLRQLGRCRVRVDVKTTLRAFAMSASLLMGLRATDSGFYI